MDISPYISELLREYKSVGLSGIGTFNRKKTSARYDRFSGALYPPIEVISFSTILTEQDILVLYISKSKKISTASAKYFINRYTENILQHLETTGEASIGALGALKKVNDRIFVEPIIAADLTFGYNPEKDPLHQDIATTTVVEPSTDNIQQNVSLDNIEDILIEKKSNIWNVIGSILLLLLITGGLTYIFNPEFFGLQSDMPIAHRDKKKDIKASLVKPISIGEDSTQRKDSLVDGEKSKRKSTTDSINSKKASYTPYYAVIGASFGLKEEAENYVKHLQSKKITAKIIEDRKKPRFKVSLGSFSTFEEATENKRHIQTSFNKEAWILTVKDTEKQ